MNVQHKEKGFTIIEVVLVLAIAGLIFLMVFIALPALQRNQRDTARKADVSIVAGAVTSYTSNNRGLFPTSAQIVTYADNVSDNSKTAAGAPNVVVGTNTASAAPADSQIVVTKGTKCGAATITSAALTTTGATTRAFTVVTKLESGGGQFFCQES